MRLRGDFDFHVNVVITGAGTLQPFDTFANQTKALMRLSAGWDLDSCGLGRPGEQRHR